MSLGRPLDHDLLEDLLGDGCLSDLELSEEEREPAATVPRLLDDNLAIEDPSNNDLRDSFSDGNVLLSDLPCRNQENIPPLPAYPNTFGGTIRRLAQKRPRIWKATAFTDVVHEYPPRPEPAEIKTPLQYLHEYYIQRCGFSKMEGQQRGFNGFQLHWWEPDFIDS